MELAALLIASTMIPAAEEFNPVPPLFTSKPILAPFAFACCCMDDMDSIAPSAVSVFHAVIWSMDALFAFAVCCIPAMDEIAASAVLLFHDARDDMEDSFADTLPVMDAMESVVSFFHWAYASHFDSFASAYALKYAMASVVPSDHFLNNACVSSEKLSKSRLYIMSSWSRFFFAISFRSPSNSSCILLMLPESPTPCVFAARFSASGMDCCRYDGFLTVFIHVTPIRNHKLRRMNDNLAVPAYSQTVAERAKPTQHTAHFL